MGDTTPNVIGAMTTAFESIQSMLLSGIAAIAPVALVVCGAILVWRFGVSFFKSLAR